MEYYTDPLTGRQYYVDPATGHSRWVEPPTDRMDAEQTQLQPQVRPQGHAWARPHPYQHPRPADSRRLEMWVKAALGSAGLAILIFLVVVALTPPQVQTIQSPGTPTGTEGTPPTTASSTTTAPSTTTPPATPSSTTPRKTSSAPVPKKTPSTTHEPPATATSKSGGGASSCDPNYSGGCVPIASDVDCAGGSGNGPAYVKGPITVVGRDIYKLDRDGDGIACE